MEYFVIIIGSIFVSNIVLAQFLGICPFVGVSGKVSTSIGMGGAVLFVLTLATMVTWIMQYYVLNPFGLGFMQTIVFILVIASLVQMVEIILKKVSPSLYSALGVFLPLITTNCAILGLCLFINLESINNLPEAVVLSVGAGLGFTLAICIMAGIRENLQMADVPDCLKGAPITLITAGILTLAFMGFAGMTR